MEYSYKPTPVEIHRMVRTFYRIPDWYVIPAAEESRLYTYFVTSKNLCEAKFARLLDCSAFCTGKDCFFCSDLTPMPTCRVHMRQARMD